MIHQALLLGTSLLPSIFACTSLVLNTTNAGYFYGRTMEFGFDIQSRPVVVPRQWSYVGTAGGNQSGLSWESQYGVAGMNALGEPFLADGVNEQGLVCGILYLPGYAAYTQPEAANASASLAPWEFCTWVLGNFASVSDAVDAVPDIIVVNVPVPTTTFVPPFHYTLHDKSGASVVIEPNNGALLVTPNPLTVMTNSPYIDFHLTNMANYMHLSPWNAQDIVLKNGASIAPFGEGSGWLGLPGDMTGPSRFIRASAFTLSALDNITDARENVRQVEHIMNNFDIPYGVVRSSGAWDYTQWTSIVDIAGGVYYVKTYNNSALQAISLSDYNLNNTAIYTATIPTAFSPPTLILS